MTGDGSPVSEDGSASTKSSGASASSTSSSSPLTTTCATTSSSDLMAVTSLELDGMTASSIPAVTPTLDSSSTMGALSVGHGHRLNASHAHGAGHGHDHDLLAAANREMFSWLLLNSENIAAAPMATVAPVHGMHGMNGAAGAKPMGPGAGHAGDLAAFSSPAMDDDPFRLISADHAPLPLTLDHAHDHDVHMQHLAMPTALAIPTGSVAPSTAIATHHVNALVGSTAPLAAISTGMHTPVPQQASGIVTPTVPSTSSSTSAKVATSARRGRKRPTADSPSNAEAGPSKNGKQGKENKTLSRTQQDLLRHLEHANDVLIQREQEGRTNARNIKAESASGSRSADSSNSESPTSLLRKQKLERNRESARECRRRKREHIQSVEERCRQLERENMELRGQLKAGKEAMKQEEREKNRVCEELEQMIQRGASEKELAEKIDNFKEQYSDYGHGRRSALRYHMHQIERLLLPTQVTKMCIWALRQDDSFWQDEEDETSLPVILARELGLTDEQKKKIQQQRGSIAAICDNLKSALGLLDELKTQVEHKNVTLDNEMDKLQNILTPTQRAKFIVWVTNNQACMHLLNKLWRSVL